MLTSLEDGTDQWDDEPILERATQLGRTLFSQDDDFLALAHEWQAKKGREFTGLIYAHPLNITIGQAVHDLELIARVLDPSDLRNRVEYIPL